MCVCVCVCVCCVRVDVCALRTSNKESWDYEMFDVLMLLHLIDNLIYTLKRFLDIFKHTYDQNMCNFSLDKTHYFGCYM